MGIRIKISKRGLIQLALFLTVIGVATLIDLYIENNPVELENLQTSNENQMDDQARVFFVSQANTLAAKSSTNRQTARILKIKSHDKLVQKHHQLRNYQVFKAEAHTPTHPLIFSYQYLVFRKFLYSGVEEDPYRS